MNSSMVQQAIGARLVQITCLTWRDRRATNKYGEPQSYLGTSCTNSPSWIGCLSPSSSYSSWPTRYTGRVVPGVVRQEQGADELLEKNPPLKALIPDLAPVRQLIDDLSAGAIPHE